MNIKMNIKNNFNGKYLEYFVDKTMYDNIVSKFNNRYSDVYVDENNISFLIPNKKFILPIGLFSNHGFILNCTWEDTDRIFYKEIKNIESNIILNNTQEIIVNEFFKHKDIIINVNKAPIYLNLVGQCSVGKTVMAIHIISVVKLKTFIITPSLDLAKQWAKEINKFLKNVNCYVSLSGVKHFLKQDRELLNKYDIICLPFKHLNNEEFNEFLINNFSLGIIDEQHKYNLNTNDTLKKFFTFYSFPLFISLTATPRHSNSFYLGREINTDKIVEEYSKKLFTKIAYEVITNDKFPESKNSDYYNIYKELKNKSHFAKKELLMSIYKKRASSYDIPRVNKIVKTIVESFTDDSKILVLTKFVEDIDKYYLDLNKYIDKTYLYKIYAIKKNNNESLAYIKPILRKKEKYIIIGTEEHLGTGIDIVELNILHLTSLTTNKRNLIQYAGRVSRNNNTPIHYIYYYNINTLKDFYIGNEITCIRDTLNKIGWICKLKIV